MSKLILLAALGCITLVLPHSAQAKANFSGVWKMDQKGSDPGPRNIVFKIEHKEPAFKYSASGETETGEPFTEDAELTTDGKPHPGPNSGKVSGRWEGETLVIVYDIGGSPIRMTLKLSPDGKRMFRELLGRREVYDKQ